MTVDFRCENCGKLLSVDADPGDKLNCPHCQKSTTVPAGLASLPRPQVPGQPTPPPQAPPEAPLAEEVLEPKESTSLVSMMMAVVISLFFHVGLALVCLFVTMVVIQTAKDKQIIIPDSTLSEDLGAELTPREVTVDQSRRTRETKTRSTSAVENPIPVDAGKTSSRLVIAAGAASGSGANWQLSGGGGGGPGSSFFGTGGSAFHVVYVVDCSGSMVDTLDIVVKEMADSIGKLQPVQDFHVVFFNNGPPIEHSRRRLVYATHNNKLEVARFMAKIIAEGSPTNPVPALKRAFEVLRRAGRRKRGKLIHLLTDGDFPNNKEVLATVAKENAKKEVHVNTYLYQFRGPEALAIMQKIAAENGGKFKYISADE